LILKQLRQDNFGQNPAKRGIRPEVLILKDLRARSAEILVPRVHRGRQCKQKNASKMLAQPVWTQISLHDRLRKRLVHVKGRCKWSALTEILKAARLMEMRLTKQILLIAVVVAIAVYAIDCGAMTTPAAAMQCCDNMPCSSHGHEHSQDCCQTMPSLHAPFLRPASVHGLFFTPVFVAVLPGSTASPVSYSPANVLAVHGRAPAIPQVTVPSPLRI
jgi:hypothetical protein